jgi:hypothetical protein
MLIVGVVLVSVASLEYRAVRAELAAHQVKLAEVRKSGKRVGASAARGRSGDVTAAVHEFNVARNALQRLSLRWTELFAALESAPASNVALLAIEPDAGKNVVKVTAEAKSAEDMLGYVERLQAASGLSEVVLASHQVRASDPLLPMRFTVVASWATR